MPYVSSLLMPLCVLRAFMMYTGERGIEGEAKAIFTKLVVNIGFSEDVFLLYVKQLKCVGLL